MWVGYPGDEPGYPSQLAAADPRVRFLEPTLRTHWIPLRKVASREFLFRESIQQPTRTFFRTKISDSVELVPGVQFVRHHAVPPICRG
jgi:hypothetical protein